MKKTVDMQKKVKLQKKVRKVETVESYSCGCSERCIAAGSAYARQDITDMIQDQYSVSM